MPNTPRFTPAQEGLQLWSITGRCFNDDDDTASLCWGRDEAEATLEFKLSSLDLTQEQLDTPADENKDAEYFMVSSELIGIVKNGEFVLSASLMPAVDDRARTPAVNAFGIFEVNLFGDVHDGSRELVESRHVIARDAEEANSCMEYRYFPTQWASSDYAQPAFDTTLVQSLDNDSQPDWYLVVECLTNIFENAKTPSSVVPAFWKLIADQGVQAPVPGNDQRNVAVIKDALISVASRLTGMAALFELLHQALPAQSNYEADDETYFGFDNEELQWACAE